MKRHSFDLLTVLLLIVVSYVVFWVGAGMLVRACKELFCIGYGC